MTCVIAVAAAGLLAAALARPALADEPPVPEDWGAALAEDARGFHAAILTNHPGPVDPENPEFRTRMDAQLALALERARTADSYPAWYFALEAFEASFNDGHLGLTRHARMGHQWTQRWPGFLTGLRDGPEGERHEVVFADDPAAPPPGAVLVGCDGRPADALARERIGDFVGRWALRSRRATYAVTLFVDQGNPWTARPEVCEFEVDGRRRSWTLTWRDLPDAVRDAGFAAARSPRYETPIALTFRPEAVWIGLGSFDGDPASVDGRALAALVETLQARADEVRAAERIVLDLRGNGGGSSGWSYQIARILWGEPYVEAVTPRSLGVDWRVSAANLALVEHYRDEVFADVPEAREWADEIVEGLRRALAEGAVLWRQGDGDPDAPRPDPGPSPLGARVYVLTDYGCASACLDAVDLFLAAGAVHVGQETSADTLYMELREDPLPSGRAVAYVPMKVYRGRARGDNETHAPVHVWTGDLADTDGIAAWILGLDAAD